MNLNLVASNFSTTIRNPEAASLIRQSILDNDGLPQGIDPESLAVKATRGGFIVTANAIAAEVNDDDSEDNSED